MEERNKPNINMRIGFWKGKMLANPKLAKIAEEEIAKLEIEKRSLIDSYKNTSNKNL